MGSFSFDFSKIETKDDENEIEEKISDETYKCQMISYLYNRFGSIQISDLYDEKYLFNMNMSGVQGKMYFCINSTCCLFFDIFVKFLLHYCLSSVRQYRLQQKFVPKPLLSTVLVSFNIFVGRKVTISSCNGNSIDLQVLDTYIYTCGNIKNT